MAGRHALLVLVLSSEIHRQRFSVRDMVFSSIIFLFAFLPIVLLFYHLLLLPVWLGSTAKLWLHLGNLFLLSCSLLFYFWGEKFLIWVFIATVLFRKGRICSSSCATPR
jgi:hypothetical protein